MSVAKANRRKWKAPNNPTPAAKQVWAFLFRDPWPKGWRVEWVGFMRGAKGLCVYSERRILLGLGDHSKRSGDPVRTLVHEFIHVRCGPGLRHGKEFSAHVDRCCEQLGIAGERPKTLQED